MPLIRVCHEDELAVGEARKLPVEPPIALFHAEDGWFALDDTCTHGQASLCEGFVDGGTVECPLHMAQFCLKTGAALTPPADKPVAAYAVVIEGGDVFVACDR
jgi:3-phenylpropionate/trans-cinnamate dioxygenase ferredoxin subunit